MTWRVSCISIAQSTQHSCNFRYTDKYKSEIVIPKIRGTAGTSFPYFDIDNPAIRILGNGTVELIFIATKEVDGRMLLDETSYIFQFSQCGRQLVRFYQTQKP